MDHCRKKQSGIPLLKKVGFLLVLVYCNLIAVRFPVQTVCRLGAGGIHWRRQMSKQNVPLPGLHGGFYYTNSHATFLSGHITVRPRRKKSQKPHLYDVKYIITISCLIKNGDLSLHTTFFLWRYRWYPDTFFREIPAVA